MFDHLFLLGALVTAIVQTFNFWIMSWHKGFMSAFGRIPLSWRSLTCLSVSAFVPMLCIFPTLYFNESFFTFEPEVVTAFLIAGINMVGLEMTKRLGIHIVIPVPQEKKQENK